MSPKLPSADDITRATPTATRHVSSYEVPQSAPVGDAMIGIGQQIVKEQEKLDDIRAEDALNQAKMRALELSKGDDGYGTKKGEEVVGQTIHKNYTDRFNKAMDDVESSLGNSNQVNKFRRRLQPLNRDYNASLLGHIAKETEDYADLTDASTLEIERSAAVSNFMNPSAVADAKGRSVYTINSTAERKGLKGKAKDAFKLTELTKFHSGVIDAMASEDVKAADKYFKKNLKEISGEEQTAIRAKLETRNVLVQSQEIADKIMDDDMDYDDAMKHVQKNYQGDVEKTAKQILKQRFHDKKVVRQDAVTDAGDWVRENKTLEGFPEERRRLLSINTINALNKQARLARMEKEPVHKSAAWADFNQLVADAYSKNPKAIDSLRNMNLYEEYRGTLDNTHFDKALGMQTAFRKADASGQDKAGIAAMRILSNKQATDEFINQLLDVKKSGPGKGGRSSKEKVQFGREFYQLAQTQFEQWYRDNEGQKMTPVQRDEILKDLASSKEVKKSFMGMFPYTSKYTIADVPNDQINEIAKELRKSGVEVTGDSIVNTYFLAKEKGLVD